MLLECGGLGYEPRRNPLERLQDSFNGIHWRTPFGSKKLQGTQELLWRQPKLMLQERVRVLHVYAQFPAGLQREVVQIRCHENVRSGHGAAANT